MNKSHLNLDSKLGCKEIPSGNLEDIKTKEEKKWKSETIRNCENINITVSSFKDIYAGHSLYSTNQFLDMVENYNRSYQERLHVDQSIRQKLADGETNSRGV